MSDDIQKAITEMSQWLTHPMEFGQAPASCRVVESFLVEWPFREDQQEVHLVEYTMPDGVTGIGVTGPITWSFLDIDFSQFTYDELLYLYAGWYICFATINSEDYAPSFSEGEDQQMMFMLATQHSMSNMEITDRVEIGGQTYFEINATGPNGPVKVCGTLDSCSSFEASSKFALLPPLFSYLGFTFYEEEDE